MKIKNIIINKLLNLLTAEGGKTKCWFFYY